MSTSVDVMQLTCLSVRVRRIFWLMIPNVLIAIGFLTKFNENEKKSNCAENVFQMECSREMSTISRKQDAPTENCFITYPAAMTCVFRIRKCGCIICDYFFQQQTSREFESSAKKVFLTSK